MKNFICMIYSFILLSMLISCNENDQDINKEIDVPERSALIVEADNQFGIELFQKINEAAETDENLMISPTSISLALAMAYNGAVGETKEQMELVLHKEELTSEEINQSYKNMVGAFESMDSKVELSVSNAVFYRDGFNVKSDFLTTNETYYDAEVQALDFQNEAATMQIVNGWVDEKTNGKIKEIISSVDPEDLMYLINAIYFNAEWTIRFDEDDTMDRNFNLEDGTLIEVPTMYVKDEFNYYAHESFEMLEMEYGSGKFSMFILLPEDGIVANDLIVDLDPDSLDTWINSLVITERQVFMPKFEFSFNDALRGKLIDLGMTDAFDPMLADFSGINDELPICVTDVLHKTYIKVDERGTEAAAVTAVVIGTTSAGFDDRFIVDHPFIFIIKERDTNAILFIGKVMNPAKS